MDLHGDGWNLLVGDVLTRLTELPERHFHAAVTSPPFWALRSYLPSDHPDKHLELGSEKTPEEFVANLVKVFAGVKRVLRDDGVCWMELGDSYNQYNHNQTAILGTPSGNTQHARPEMPPGLNTGSLGIGNQLLMPHRVALALQADGWTVRQTVVWGRGSPMPESINGCRWVRCRVKVKAQKQAHEAGLYAAGSGNRTCRPGSGGVTGKMPEEFQTQWTDCPGCPKCLPNGGYVLKRGSWRHTTATSYVFMLTKGMGYFSDAEAAKENSASPQRAGKVERTFSTSDSESSLRCDTGRAVLRTTSRNPRSVLTLATEPFKEAHFATFPPTLVYKLLAPVVSKRGCCPECGEPCAPVVESDRVPTRPGVGSKVYLVPPVHPESPVQTHSGTVC